MRRPSQSAVSLSVPLVTEDDQEGDFVIKICFDEGW